ncbi:baseplate J/gp47 family protein [Paenibacillus koleovorans]|uniref:baseplate J/gp47 family protein n=1 Tax=Paenibacillus koleovorans TaxID=121608 RepID=UPI000FDC7E1E|nr:baseplate J/gp47 family protein [Paenibacillus koleovorans]
MHDLIDQMKQLTPYYTPEWRFNPDNPDPGTALFLIFAQLFLENVKRFNQVPVKNFISYLNLFDIALEHARPAQTYMQFRLAEGAAELVHIPAGTQVSGSSPLSELPVVFETNETMYVTPAKLLNLFAVSTRQDKIIHVYEGVGPTAAIESNTEPMTFYEFEKGRNLQEHGFYIMHDDLFLVKGPAQIQLRINHTHKKYAETSVARLLGPSPHLEWGYFTEDGWLPFDRVEVQGTSVFLTKEREVELIPQAVNEVEGRWIGCRVKSLAAQTAAEKLQQVELDGIVLKTDYYDPDHLGGIVPDQMFFNDIQVDRSGFLPFGDFFVPYSTFYISSEEAFSKKESWVDLSFRLSCRENRLFPDKPPEINWKLIMKRKDLDKHEIPDQVSILNVLWEYWNGQSWVRLSVPKTAEEVFYDPLDSEKKIRFRCPYDMQKTFVNSDYNYWIRARIVSIQNLYASNSIYKSPWIEELKLRYEYQEPQFISDRVTSYNNLEYIDRTRDAALTGNSFKPFYMLEGKEPAVYFHFDQPIERGPVNLYFSLQASQLRSLDIPLLEWEYLARRGNSQVWTALKLIDHTQNFTQTGTIRFLGPTDYAEHSLFGARGFWIRAVNRDSKFELKNYSFRPQVYSVYMNTVQIVQQMSLTQELPERVIDPLQEIESGHTEFVMNHTPILSEEVWVDETGYVTENDIEDEWTRRHKVQVIRDSEGHIQKCWVRYEPVKNLLMSGPYDRQYVIQRTTGRLVFGNGRHGKQLPHAGEDRVMVHYKTGGGLKGNMRAGEINSLQSSIAFIDSVTNIEASSGGSEQETINQVFKRGTQVVRHRNRAVTVDDFEWLAREAYPNISKVKCLTGINVKLEKEPGAITLVILPEGGFANRLVFQQLKKQVEQFLLERAAASVAFPGTIQVIEPVYLEISLYSVISVKEMEEVVPTELDVIHKLEQFLNPFTGNYNSRGWSIGETIHISMFIALLKSINSVVNVEKLVMFVQKVENGKRTEILPDTLKQYPHSIVTNGKHQIQVKTN